MLDIKRGNGSFMPEPERGLELARTMIGIGDLHGCRTVAIVTAMDRPLGHAVGNAIETEEAIMTLRGEGPADLVHVTLALAAEMLVLAGKARRPGEGFQMAEAALKDGRAADLMRRIIEAQGGNPDVMEFIANLHPMKRMAKAEEIAQAAVFLLSDRSSFMTGSPMIADGGMSVRLT